jgi:hypothetical protein
MLRPAPRKIWIEYDDGSKVDSPFDALPFPLQAEILRQPFASRPSPSPEEEKFILLEWNEGWKEVIEVDRRCTAIHRYYVISRPEDIGRLSLGKEDGYPELLEILRRPMDLKRLTFVDTFRLGPAKSEREGKKTDHFFPLTKDTDGLSELYPSFKEALAEEGMTVKELEAQDPAEPGGVVERIARRLGLRAGQRQQDLLDFLIYLGKNGPSFSHTAPGPTARG